MSGNGQANVSVIIPCYCCAETVERALDSVVRQTMTPAEIILVDDASNDDGKTLSRLRQLCHIFGKEQEIPIRLIELQTNVGPSGARNAAWDAATADYIALLDADDAWHPQKLEIQYSWMEKHPKVAMCGHSRKQVEDSSDFPLDVEMVCAVRKCCLYTMLFRNPLATSGVMLRRDIALRFAGGRYYSEDYLLWLEIVASGLQVFVMDLVLAYSFKPTFGESGMAANSWNMEKGIQDNFRRLHKAGTIGVVTWILVSSFSLLKHLRRMLIVMCRRVSG